MNGQVITAYWKQISERQASKGIFMVKKNDIIDLTIEDLGVNGEGIGKVDGYTLFVKDGVIGD